MEFLDNLLLGFTTALTWQNLLYCFIGCALGTLIGVLPGLGPIPTLTLLLPFTYGLEPASALIMLAGIYYGAQYGGSTTAILLNLPGESSAAVTALDGYKMARSGRAGPALASAALGSFFAGCVGTVVIAAFAPPMTALALEFRAPEYFALMLLGLIGAVVLAHGSLLKAIAMTILGLLLGLVGTDINSGTARYTFGIPDLLDGIDFVVIAMGMFGLGEIIANLASGGNTRGSALAGKIGRVWPSRQDFREGTPAVLRGTVVGSALGILPGGGALLSSFAAYTVEKKLARNPDPPFGEGNIRGVAGPEAANNAGSQTSFIPMLTLGIPSNATMAVMVGAMAIHNIEPGPRVMTSNPELFWGLIASMWIGNVILVILNLPLVGIWTRFLSIPYRLLYPGIVLFCAIGVYTIGNNSFDIWVLSLFGVMGYVFHKLGCEATPLLLGFILGPMLEENFRRALMLARGDFSVFVSRPISLGLLLLTATLLVVMISPAIRRKRKEAFAEE
jgi:putative tricarboxylic transport membrane protein